MELDDSLVLGLRLSKMFANTFANKQEVHPVYEESVNIRESIRVHFHYGSSPAKLIDESRPHETTTAKEYRIDSYEQSTFSYAQKIIGLQKGAIFHPDLYGLRYPKQPPLLTEDIPIEAYLKEEIPNIDGSIEKYMVEFIHQVAMVDPNGFVAILPATPDYEIEDPSLIRKPYPTYIPCTHVLDYSSEHLFARSSEISDINSTLDGEVFILFTPVATIKYVERVFSVKNADVEFDEFIIELHESGKMRARQLGGISTYMEGHVLEARQQKYFLSHIQAAIPYFNLALKQQSDFQASVTAHLFPRLYEAYSDCPRCNSLGYLDADNPETSGCPTCRGEGRIVSATSPLMTYTVEPNEAGVVNPPAGYISPDVAVIGETKQIRDGYLRDALRSLNMEMLLEGTTSQTQTAEAKRIDRESLHSHFREVAKTLFDLYQWTLDSINDVRYGPILSEEDLEANRVTIIRPRTYITVLPFEALQLVQQANDSQAHHGIRVRLQEETIDKLFGESIQGSLAKVALRLDPFPLYTADDIMAMGALMNISDDDTAIHFSISKLVDLAFLEDPMFLKKTLKEQKAVVMAIYEKEKQEREPEIPPQTPIILSQ